MNSDTICALATANGTGAIGIIRISGEDAFKIVNKIFEGQNLENVKSHTIHYGFIKDVDEIIDEVMISVFHAPKTFTTENSAEISFHGSPFIAKKILEILMKNGARMAKAGEFTMRAFLGGRIDISQAESIADLIASENEASRKVAMSQLKGGISNEISVLRNDLLNFTSLIELELDFSEEDVEFADRTSLLNLIQNLKHKIQNLIDSFQYGNALKNGVNVAIIGKPNAGKSTLLNTLLKEERAIVSEIAGTTRDTIEEILHIKGLPFRLIDTAGLRETTDEIEAIGVKKAKEKIEKANILIYLIDAGTKDFVQDIEIIKSLINSDLKLIICTTKIDKTPQIKFDEIENKFRNILHFPFDFMKISAVENIHIQDLKDELFAYVEKIKTEESNVIITNQRHFEVLQKSLESINNIENAVNKNITTELLAYELRNALEHLGEISGEFTNDEILGNIFSKFCIGK
jgi:tRNA modification GTPase